MKVGKTRRARLMTAAVAALAVTALGGYMVGEVGAQPQSSAWTPDVDCPPQNVARATLLPRDFRRNQVSLNASSTLGIIQRDARRPEATIAEIEGARNACREEGAPNLALRPLARGAGVNVPAYLCVGEVSQTLAERSENREANYTQAYCAYRTAAELMRIAQAPAADIATAHEMRARAAMARRSLSAGQTQQSLALLQAARSAYEEAVRVPTAGRYFDLSIVLTDLGLPAEARRAIDTGIALPTSGADGARSLVRFAEYRQSQGAPQSEVLGLLTSAQNAARNSVSVNAAIGNVHMRGGNQEAARVSYEAANRPDAINDSETGPGAINYLAAARIGLAEIGARTAQTPDQWRSVQQYATSALQAGGGGPEYNRPLCLAYVALGGDAVRDGGANAAWCEAGSGPETQLLRGLYLLRHAQYFTNFGVRNVSNTERDWRRYVNDAESAFEEGRRLIAADRTPLTDPRAIAVRQELDERLAYGADLADWVGEFCRTSAPTSPHYNFFNNLHVAQCRP